MGFEYLSRYFPPPQFLKPPHSGLSFSDSSIKVVSFDKKSPHSTLKSLIVPLEGAISNGKIINPDELANKLSVVRENLNSPFVFFTIPDELAYVFSVTIPVVKGSNPIDSVAFTIEENVPLSLTDTIFDFVPIKVFKSESDYNAYVVVAAGVKKEIEHYVETINKSGLEAVGCVHESQSIANAVIPQNFAGSSCIVHSRRGRIGIYLVKDGVVHFATLRTIDDGDYKKQFLDEYEKFFEFSLKYSTNENDVIKNVFVCGEFEYAKKTTEAIFESGKSMKEAKLSNVWSNVLRIEKDPPNIPYEDSLNLAGPIGAVLSDIK